VKLVSDRTGMVVRSKVFEAAAPISGTDAQAVVNGLNAAFDAVARSMVKWVFGAV
jgi:cholesterol transport system auxiliary component